MTEEEITASVISRLGGWVPHTGNECPVEFDTIVRVRLKGGLESSVADKAGHWMWGLEAHGRIVAYKICNKEGIQ